MRRRAAAEISRYEMQKWFYFYLTFTLIFYFWKRNSLILQYCQTICLWCAAAEISRDEMQKWQPQFFTFTFFTFFSFQFFCKILKRTLLLQYFQTICLWCAEERQWRYLDMRCKGGSLNFSLSLSLSFFHYRFFCKIFEKKLSSFSIAKVTVSIFHFLFLCRRAAVKK